LWCNIRTHVMMKTFSGNLRSHRWQMRWHQIKWATTFGSIDLFLQLHCLLIDSIGFCFHLVHRIIFIFRFSEKHIEFGSWQRKIDSVMNQVAVVSYELWGTDKPSTVCILSLIWNFDGPKNISLIVHLIFSKIKESIVYSFFQGVPCGSNHGAGQMDGIPKMQWISQALPNCTIPRIHCNVSEGKESKTSLKQLDFEFGYAAFSSCKAPV
jgi:hypothetical protein